MKIKKSLIKDFNAPENLLVISNYPKKGEIHSQGVCGLASFTKNTLQGIRSQYPRRNIVVLTMIDQEAEVYDEDGILVIRCFRRNNPFSYFTLLRYLILFDCVTTLLVEFEFASFGNFLPPACSLFV